jgi:Putative peptidase family
MKSRLLCGALSMALAAAVAHAGTGARIKLRVVNSAKAPAAALGLAQERAAYVLAQAGVEVVWQDCSAGEVGVCAGQIESGEFWLHVANWKPSTASGEALGFTARNAVASVDGSIAGVYYPAVRQMAASFQAAEGDVLGAALAHEIGHLLGADHAPTGIMRARFNRQCIVELSQGGLLFGRNQAAHIRAGAKFSWIRSNR